MIRKLIQLSPSTSVVSLPSSWTKANKLRKGASLYLDVIDNRVIVSKQQAGSRREICIDISKFDGRLMWVAIDTAYVAGYDSIIIQTRDAAQSSYLSKVVKNFPGMMIIDERKTMVHFTSMEESPPDLDLLMNRIFSLNITLIEESIEAIRLKEWDVLQKIKYRDYIINSYVSYCLRSISKYNYSPFSKIGAIHSLIKVLEMLSDKLCSLFESIGEHKAYELKIRPLELILEIYRQVRQVHSRYSSEGISKLDEDRIKLKNLIKTMPSYSIPQLDDLADLFFAIEELEMQLNS